MSNRCHRGALGRTIKPVVVPTGYTLPFKIVDGVKVFHLIAEEVEHAFDSGLRANAGPITAM